LTDEENIEQIRALIEKRGKIKGKAVRQRRIVLIALGPKDGLYEVCASLAHISGDDGCLNKCLGRPKENVTGYAKHTNVVIAPASSSEALTDTDFSTVTLFVNPGQLPSQPRRGRPRKEGKNSVVSIPSRKTATIHTRSKRSFPDDAQELAS